MRVENLEHLLNEEATDINEMLKVSVVINIIAIIIIIVIITIGIIINNILYHCFITIIFIIIKWMFQVISNIQTGKEGIDIKSMKKRYMWSESEYPKKKNFDRNMKKRYMWLHCVRKRGSLKETWKEHHMWSSYVWKKEL